ncbi:Cna B-type domain-containing protein [Kurthia sibirica]|uniref:Gram-positive cocci surface proteins LPxTG domain-containing protein n=1 Tax=Kurthia sibirica TaxID=202750 RepID=A0A2U3AH90_9BACL|nr:Cna B-type domain-containing protein [Kurthia sibirica]PWI23909.1 hypothetical protein DEX24_15380 [Kurthia sibirica]GEK34904.1 hypothetical protein KSI01_24370 [Kurthia sibirica]
MKKFISIFCSFLIASTLFMDFFVPKADALDFNGDPYVTNIEMKTPENTTIVNGGTMEVNKTYKLHYDWKIPDGKYNKGDVLNFSIPKEFIIVNNFAFELSNNGQVVAFAKILGNSTSFYYISMEFTTNYVSTHSSVTGAFDLQYKLNERFIKEGNNALQFPPDKIVNVDIPKVEEGGGGGGDGSGAGNPTNNYKTGEFKNEVLKNPITGEFDTPAKLMNWDISLGKSTLLGRASSFDEIDSITIEDKPVDQELIPIGFFQKGRPNAYGYEKGFYNKISFSYQDVPQSRMNMKQNPVGKYYESFKMNILPTIRDFEKRANDNNDVFRQYSLEYYTKPLEYVPEDRDFKNSAMITINYKNGPPESWTLESTLQWSTGSGSITGATAGVEMKKVDATTNTGLSGAIFDLYRLSRSGEYVKYQENLTSDRNGVVKTDKLITGNYYFQETKAPTGYQLTTDKKYFEVKTEDLGTNQVINIGTLKNSPDTTTISVIKKWDDNKDQDGLRPEYIMVDLLADGVKYLEEELTAGDNYSHTWEKLPKTKDGKEIKYTVKEQEKIPNYTMSIVENPNGVFTITNKHIPELTEIMGEKIWSDQNDQDGIRPTEIKVILLADGDIVKEQTVQADTNGKWSYSFDALPKYEDGELIEYDVVEELIPDYSMTQEGNNIRNTKTLDKTARTVIKIWEDEENQDAQRPESIAVELYKNGVATGNKENLTEKNNWTHTWQDLDVNENGEKIVYTVGEANVPGYPKVEVDSSSIPGTIILKNIRVPDTTEINGEKTWNDKNNQDGKRPNQIQVNLMANNVLVDQRLVSASDNWKYEFTDLPVNQDGKKIVYTVTEDPVPGYDGVINGTNLTNSYTPEKTELTGKKTWDDQDDQDRIRPDSVEIQLVADGVATGDKTTAEKDEWTYEFKNLDKYKNGNLIKYTVKETPIEGYTPIFNNQNIINKHTPETVDLAGEKKWQDGNNQDGIRPETIRVNLYGDGMIVAQRTATAATNWAYEFKNQPKYDEGQEIKYTVKEEPVPGYTTTINGFNVINSYKPETTIVKGQKTWVDGENQDGIRPLEIIVELYGNGVKVDQKSVTALDQWAYEFTDLPKNKEGKEIIYTIKEEPIPGYTVAIDGKDIKNTHKPAEIAIKGKKTWSDANDQDGKRTEQVIVNLLANGKQVDERIVTADDNWTYEFTNLPKYEKGVEIEYDVTEELVKDYSTSYDGTTILNSYTPGKTARTVLKVWNDQNNQDAIRPESIDVQLYEDGNKLGSPVKLDEKNDWSYTWKDLDERKAGKDIVYTANEIGAPAEYEVVLDNETTPGTIVIANNYTPETVEVGGEKKWDDANDQDGKRTSKVIVNLIGDGELVAEKEVTADENWQYEFTNLPKYDQGIEIEYKVTEELVKDYSTSVDDTTITNAYTPGKTARTVMKFWDDEEDQDGKRADSIDVQLYANNQPYGEKVTLNEENDWVYTWEDLDEMKDGKKIDYHVKELRVPNAYEVDINNETTPGTFIIVNKYIPEEVDIKGSKKWADHNNQDGKRPSKITVNLLADGEKIDEQQVTSKDKWQYTFAQLPKYRDGSLIAYTVTENHVSGYTTAIKKYTITNQYTPGKTSATAIKRWEDNKDQYGKRPTSIAVQLYANGKKQGSKVKLNDDNKWRHTWKNLDERSKGQKIKYTIKEETTIKGYTVKIDQSNIGSMIITNKYTGKSGSIVKPNKPNKPLHPINPIVPLNPLKPNLPNIDSVNSLGTVPNILSKNKLPTTNPLKLHGLNLGNPDDIIKEKTAKKGFLPQTGEQAIWWYGTGGVLLIMISIWLFTKRRQRKSF